MEPIEDECCLSPLSVASIHEESDFVSGNLLQTTLNPLYSIYAPVYHSAHRTKAIVRHNFKSIDALLSPVPTCSHQNDDTGYNSQLSTSLHSQDDDDGIENLKPTIASTPSLTKNIKAKKIRTAFTDDQKQCLDRFYAIDRYPDPTQIETLSRLLLLEEKVIRVWFQNKRSREKFYPHNHSNPVAAVNT